MSAEQMKEIKYVSISEDEYKRLIYRDNWLQCLESAGVDNWVGYGDAGDIYNEYYKDKD